MKYLSSLLFIAATCILAWHEALSTVSKHGTVDLISTWGWHVSQFLIVILFTASGAAFGWWMMGNSFYLNGTRWLARARFDYKALGKITVAGLAPALVIYQFLYPWLCGVVR